ncbi:MAG: hypothetical protein JO097_21100, partial [Acidobacteriaceae bacterium]|nr:hypothetical protein [Acidobacteriaceae bacterium]
MLSTPAQESFTSLSAVRAEHREIQKLYRAEGDHPIVLQRIEDFVERAKATGALLDSDADRAAVQSLIELWVGILYKATSREVHDPFLVPYDPSLNILLDESIVPYLGLEPFSEENKDLFFGRQALVQKILEKLETSNCVAVKGPSGSGKSSLVLAGVLPALRAETAQALPNGARHPIRILPRMVPGSQPLVNLARAFRQVNEASDWIEQQVDTFSRDPGHLRDLTESLGAEIVVLLVDQFEEISTLCEDQNARKAFEENVLQFATVSSGPRRNILLLTMRNDFPVSVLALQDEFKALLEKALEPMVPMSAAELHDAIEKPAERIGLKFEPGVVDALVHDILGEPAALPLLQFTLLRLWETREHNYITLNAYRDLGGGREALTRTADHFLQSLTPEERTLVERIFLRLVRPGPHGENVANRYLKSSLYTLAAPERVDIALAKLQRARLIRITGGPNTPDAEVEVAHEALVRNWRYLDDLLDKERERLTTRQRLEAKADEWVRLGRGKAGLLTDAALAQAIDWLSSRDSEEVGASKNLGDLVQRSQRAALIAKRWRLAWISALVGLSIIAVFTAVAALRQRNLAERQSTIAQQQTKDAVWNWNQAKTETKKVNEQDAELKAKEKTLLQQKADLTWERALAQQAAAEADEKATLYDAGKFASSAERAMDMNQGAQPTLLLTLQAAYTLARKKFPLSSDVGDALHRAVAVHAERFEVPLGAPVSNVTFSPDGAFFATVGPNQRVRIWNSSTGELVRSVGPPNVTAIAYSPNGKALAMASNSRIDFLDPAGTVHQAVSLDTAGPVQRLLYSPNGIFLAASSGNQCFVWNLQTGGEPVTTLSGHAKAVQAVAFSMTGDFVATGSDDGTAKIWDGQSGRLLRTLDKRPFASLPPSPVREIVFSPNGYGIAVVSDDQTITYWTSLFPLTSDPLRSSPTPSPYLPLIPGSFQGVGAAFTPDGATLLTVGTDGLLRKWSASTYRLNDAISLETRTTEALAFSFDRSHLLLVDNGRIAHMVKIDATEELLTLATGMYTASASIAPGGTRIAALSGRNVQYWNLSNSGHEFVGSLQANEIFPYQLALNASGTLAALRTGNGISLINLPNGPETPLVGVSSPRFIAAFAFAGDQLITADSSALETWDPKTQTNVASVSHGLGPLIKGLAVSPDAGRLALLGGTGAVAMWDIRSSPPRQITRANLPGNTSMLAFSPDGKLLATAATDFSCRLWSESTLQPQGNPLTGHTAAITGLAFSADSKLLAASSLDRSIMIWPTAKIGSPESVQTVSRVPGDTLAIQFTGPENDIVAAQNDGSIRVLATKPNRLLRAAFARITNPMQGGTNYLNGSVQYFAEGNRFSRSGKLAEAEAQFGKAQAQLPAFLVEPAILAFIEQQSAQSDSDRIQNQGQKAMSDYLQAALSDAAKKAAAADFRAAAIYMSQNPGTDSAYATGASQYLALLQKANSLDASTVPDPKSDADTLVAEAYTRIAANKVASGNIQEALNAIDQARRHKNPSPSDTDAAFQNQLC